jgi:small GTP-binding protein
MVDNENFQLDILDTAGRDAFRSMYVSSMHQSMGFIIVYAIEDRVSFEEVEVLHLDLMGIKGTAEIPVVICGNKCDLAENNRVVSKEEGEELASKLSAIFFETSVLANINVENAFAALVKRCEVF